MILKWTQTISRRDLPNARNLVGILQMTDCFLAEKNDNVIKWDQDPKSSRVPVAYPHKQHVITPTDRTYKTYELKLQHSQGLYRLSDYISSASNIFPHSCSQGHVVFRFGLKSWGSSIRGS